MLHARRWLNLPLRDPRRGRQTATTANPTGQLRRLRLREVKTLARGPTAGIESQQSDSADWMSPVKGSCKAHILETAEERLAA